MIDIPWKKYRPSSDKSTADQEIDKFIVYSEVMFSEDIMSKLYA